MEFLVNQQRRIFSDFVIEQKVHGEWVIFDCIDYHPDIVPNTSTQLSDGIRHITNFLEQHLRPARLGFQTANEQYNPVRYRIRNLKTHYIYNLSMDDNGMIMLDFPNGNKLPAGQIAHR